MTTTADCGKSEAELLALPLSSGSHGSHFGGECCLVEKANRIATCVPAFRERYGAADRFADDHPSVSRVVRAMAIGLNDLPWESDEARTAALDRFTIAILGTATTEADETTRAYMACDWLIRVYAPAWLRLAGLTAEAQALEQLARVADAATVSAARPVIDAARERAARCEGHCGGRAQAHLGRAPHVRDFAAGSDDRGGSCASGDPVTASQENEPMSAETARIERGIEWFPVENGEQDCQCARCGSSCEFLTCWNCGGDDEALGSDCIDDLCHGGECIHGDSGFIRCDWCGGAGGAWHCISSPEWCNAHPMVGREGVTSTALNPHAWSDE